MVVVSISGTAAEAAIRSDVNLTADDWFDAGLAGCLVELDNAIHGAVVGYRQAVHAQFLGSGNE